MEEKTIHIGRAANCSCLHMEGLRCPDCNHLLSQETYGLVGTRVLPLIICEVCGRTLLGKLGDEVSLEVQDFFQDNLNQF